MCDDAEISNKFSILHFPCLLPTENFVGPPLSGSLSSQALESFVRKWKITETPITIQERNFWEAVGWILELSDLARNVLVRTES